MGADLYIPSINDRLRKKFKPKFEKAVADRNRLRDAGDEKGAEEAQKIVAEFYEKMYEEGYFRDSYNSTSVAWRIGLSWWSDVVPMLDKSGRMPLKNVKKLLEKVRTAVISPVNKEWLEAQHCRVDDGENSPEAWNKDFEERRLGLVKFLEKCLELGEKPRMSL